MNKRLIDVALGKTPADMVIKNGRLINVFTREIYAADIAIADQRIAAVGKLEEGVMGEHTEIIDADGKYLAPGFIDAHIHFESSMLTYTEFAKMVVKRGTTAVASDLMEVAIVSGMEGINSVFEEASKTPVHLLYPVPSFMEEEGDIQTIGAPLHAQMMEELIKRPQAVGFAEVLYPPILAKSPASEKMLELAKKYSKTAEGHAPALGGSQLSAYASTGIRSDHESTDAPEALEKLRNGIRILIREGSAAKDLEKVIKIITKEKVDSRFCSLVSDDIDMLHIYEKGHLDYKVRMATELGVDPIEAIQMVTINPAESLKVADDYGSITPGKKADIVFLTDIKNCSVDSVVADGVLVVEGQELCHQYQAYQYPESLKNTVHLKKKITKEDLIISTDASVKKVKARVIGAQATTLLTDDFSATLQVKDGIVQCNVDEDVLYIDCIERHGKHGSIGKSFIKGFKFDKGAIATSVGHDHHNITTVGCNHEDMAIAVNRLAEIGGGIIIVEEGKVLFEISLPICGLLGTSDGETQASILKAMQENLKSKGCTMESPYMTLAFITLIFIPMYGITDRGLYDVLKGKLVDPLLEILQ